MARCRMRPVKTIAAAFIATHARDWGKREYNWVYFMSSVWCQIAKDFAIQWNLLCPKNNKILRYEMIICTTTTMFTRVELVIVSSSADISCISCLQRKWKFAFLKQNTLRTGSKGMFILSSLNKIKLPSRIAISKDIKWLRKWAQMMFTTTICSVTTNSVFILKARCKTNTNLSMTFTTICVDRRYST